MPMSIKKHWMQYLSARLFPLFILFCILTGCGTTPLLFKQADPLTDFSQYKSLGIRTDTHGAIVPSAAQIRVKQLVKAEIAECCAQRFEILTIDSSQPHDLIFNIKFTVYEEGNRFARLMLAGLGSMQIHAQVELLDAKSGNLLTAGEAGKTFAWGGIYGAATGIEDLEKDFAKEIAKGLREALRLDSQTP